MFERIMDKIVSNATPLIYLAKANQLQILREVVFQVFIPQRVYHEVVAEGKRLEEEDAYLVDEAVKEGWISVHQVKKQYPVQIPIHPGEREVISLAKELGILRVLMDDTKARKASELLGLKPTGTLGILLRAVAMHKLTFEHFLDILEGMVQSGFYLREEVYLKAVHEAHKLSGCE